MLNKNDPLIGAVQEVMKRNQAERDAVNLVNEKFGVTDRKALPHEQQSAWDAAYKQVLSEGISVERVPVSKTPPKILPKTQPVARGQGVSAPKILPKTQPGTSVQGGEGIQGYDKQSRSAGSVRPKGDNPKVNMEEEALGEAIKPYKPTAGSDDPGYKRLMRQAHKDARSDMPQREFAKEYTGMGKHRKTIANTPLKHVHRLKVDKDGKAFLPMEEEALDEKVKMTKQQFANLDGDPKFTANDLHHARKGTHVKKAAAGNLEEDETSPSSMGIKPDYASGTPDYANKGPQMVNRAAKTSAPAGTVSGTVKEAVMNKVMKKLKSVNEGAKVDRMVDRIKRSEMEAGKSAKEAEDIAWATANKRGMLDNKNKKVDEGFNGRHNLSVNASVQEQVVAGQLNERLSSTAQRKAQLAPTYTQGIKQTRARLAREPAEPKKSFSQRAAEVGRGIEATARGVAAGVTDFGQTSFDYKPLSDYALDAITPGRGENLKREFPTLSRVAKDAGEVGSMATGIGGLVKGGTKAAIKSTVKNAADDVARTTTQTAKTATAAKSATQAADELSPATKERMSRYIEKRVGDRPSSTAKPTSRAAREPATSEPKNAIQKAIRDAEAERNAAKTIDRADQTPNTRVASPDSPIRKAIEKANTSRAAREPDEIIPPNRSATPSGNAGIRGTFRDNLAKARQNAGSDPKARQLPALRRTTEPTNYVRPGVPAVRPANGANLPARPGMPNLAAGGATRVVGLSDKAKAGLGAGAAAAALTGYAMTRGNQPSTTQAATSTAQGPSFEKTGRGSAPSLPAKQPASSAASASASAPPQAPAQPVRKAAPQDSSTPAQRAQFNRQIDRGIAAPGTQYKGLGVKTGTTIKQAPAPAVKRPVGTGREK